MRLYLRIFTHYETLRWIKLVKKKGPKWVNKADLNATTVTVNLSLFLQAQKKELDHIRQKYRKNSLARTPTTSLREENKSEQQQTKSQKRIEEED